jgi:hypothetical protein
MLAVTSLDVSEEDRERIIKGNIDTLLAAVGWEYLEPISPRELREKMGFGNALPALPSARSQVGLPKHRNGISDRAYLGPEQLPSFAVQPAPDNVFAGAIEMREFRTLNERYEVLVCRQALRTVVGGPSRPSTAKRRGQMQDEESSPKSG